MTPSVEDALTSRPDPKAAAEQVNLARAAEQQHDRWTALEHYRQAFVLNSDDAEICFALAYQLDLVGEEDEALQLYERCVADTDAKLNALVNLAILYEDHGEYTKAEKCLRLVVDTDPNHARARLYYKDVVASREMYIHEESPQRINRPSGLMETPIGDYDLSARARNCLHKINIRTLGDLLRISEAELMAYKNFGETTLLEIKAMLAHKRLHIGQALEQQHDATRQEVYDQLKDSVDEQTMNVLNQSVDELKLSVRAKKALALLNIHSVGDLVSRTEAELLGIKNFGSTSLDEIKERLEAHGLSLRTLDEG